MVWLLHLLLVLGLLNKLVSRHRTKFGLAFQIDLLLALKATHSLDHPAIVEAHVAFVQVVFL